MNGAWGAEASQLYPEALRAYLQHYCREMEIAEVLMVLDEPLPEGMSVADCKVTVERSLEAMQARAASTATPFLHVRKRQAQSDPSGSTWVAFTVDSYEFVTPRSEPRRYERLGIEGMVGRHRADGALELHQVWSMAD